MLNIKFKVQGKTLDLPPVSPGETGSMTDLTDNTLILFACNEDDDGALITRSVAGFHTDVGDARVVNSIAARPLAILTEDEHFHLQILSNRGPMDLYFEHAYG